MHKLKLYLLSLTVLISLGSCEEENSAISLPDDLPIPSHACMLSFSGSSSFNGTTADVNWIFEPILLADFDLWGLRIKHVDYYLDDIHQYSTTESPYTFTYIASNVSYGTHTVRAVYTIARENHNDITIENSRILNVGNGKQEQDTEQYLNGRFWVDCDCYIKKGEPLVVTPYVVKEQSDPECKIKKVEYTWDGILIATQTTEPFSLSYPINEEEGTSHQLSLNIIYGGKGYKDKNYNYLFTNISIMEKTTNTCTFELMSSVNSKGEYEYKNGNTLRGIGKVFLGEAITDAPKVLKVYWDNKVIDESRTFPYIVAYKLIDQSVGTHKLKYEWTDLDESGKPAFSFSQTKIINITE